MAIQVYTVFGQGGGDVIASDTLSYTRGMQFSLSQPAALTGIWWFSPSSATILPTSCGIYRAATPSAGSGVIICEVSSPAWSGAAGSGWVKCTFDGGILLAAGVQYKVCVQSNGGANWYSATAGYWTGGFTTGIITATSNAAADGGQNSSVTPSTGSVLTYPGSTSAGANLWVDVEVTTGLPGPAAPVPGLALASPRTWNPGDQVTTPRLRGDMTGLAALMGQGRPLFWGHVAVAPNNPGLNTVNLSSQNNVALSTWNSVLLSQNSGTAQVWPVPLPGWYLLQGWAGQPASTGGVNNSYYNWGMAWSQGTSSVLMRSDFGECAGPSVGTYPSTGRLAVFGQSSAELVLLNSATGDFVGSYAVTSNAGVTSFIPFWGVEWVGLPSSGTINGSAYTGPVGTVVANPKPASLWPAGPGGTLAASVSSGGTVLSLGPVAGLRAGGTIGLDWQGGQQSQVYAETATVAAVTGGTVTVTAPLLYGHSAGAPVAVPVSAAFLNEQIRDQNNYLFYPPLLRAVQGTGSVQSIASNTWTIISLALSGAGISNTVDNFGGFTPSAYTIPVSGVYLIIGQVYFAGATAATSWGARLLDNNGATYSGDFYATHSSSGAIPQAPAVRRVLRLTAGQTISLQGFQNSGGAVNTNPVVATGVVGSGPLTTTANVFPRLIVVWRSF